MEYCSTGPIPHSVFKAWDPTDQAKAIAFVLEKSLLCPMCGTGQWQWDEDPYAFEPVAERCQGCYAKETMSSGMESAPGVTVQLSPTNTPDAIARRERAEALAERDRADRELYGDDDD